MQNRLSKETSPYLLQHQNNPVDWYPWGSEALERAKRENKPILLSVGYSACHWCHVMEHESFENPDVARLMNDHFVNIKVDREERPDLDQIYQNVAQAMTQGGGWPLTVFLTPDLRPFFGGTYFPPEDKYGRPGFARVLKALSDAYQNDLEGVIENAQKLTDYISSFELQIKKESKIPQKDDFLKIAEDLLDRVDWSYGGLGHAPKFPNSMIFTYLWRIGTLTQEQRPCEAVRLSLSQMANGGLYDQLGGGFHRYSVDESWSVPHFEKMLYDNALLLRLYSEVLLTHSSEIQAQERELYIHTVSQTIRYIFREMKSADGVFYSAQDADTEGEEGKFFVWDLVELEQILTPEELEVFAMRYGVTQTGNFEHGKTVLFVAEKISDIARKKNIPLAQVEGSINEACRKVLAARNQRTRPGLDHKVLVSWNALMISGLAWAAQALRKNGQVEFANEVFQAADQAYEFILKNLNSNSHRLKSTFQGGQGKLNAYLDDYAFMAMAALDLSRWTADTQKSKNRISQCENWIQIILKHFKDQQSSGYFFTSDDHEVLIQRPKSIYDQAIPSGTAVALTCMIALSEINFEGRGGQYAQEAQDQLQVLFKTAEKNPYGMGEFLNAALLQNIGPLTVSGSDAHGLCTRPFVFQKPSLDTSAQAGVLICHHQECSLPVTNLSEAELKIDNAVGKWN